MIATEKTDKIEHTCGTCGHAREDERLTGAKLICRDGYGFRDRADKGCQAWRDRENEEVI